MVNTRVFKTVSPSKTANTVNAAGGRAYKTTNEHSLAQFAVTGTFNDTFYTSAEEQLKQALELADTVNSTFIARLAIYARKNGFMKDMPALLLAILSARNEHHLLRQAFPKVINTGRMLRTFVQIVRSGVTGRKNFGSAARKLINGFITSRDNSELFADSMGQSPSLADILRMTHPRPDGPSQEALFGYILDRKDYSKSRLPAIVQQFEALKAGESKTIPDVPLPFLTNMNLSVAQWRQKALQLPWNSLRMSLVTLHARGVFDGKGSEEFNRKIAEKLSNAEDVRRSKVFPYSIFLAHRQAASLLPNNIVAALHTAMEASLANIPEFGGKVLIALDRSGSMGSAVMQNKDLVGYNRPARAVEVGALFATAIARKNDFDAIGFDTSASKLPIDPADSIITNTQRISLPGGGTDVSCAIRHWNTKGTKGDLIVIISDNESWFGGSYGRYGATSAQTEWETFKKRNPGAAIVCINLTVSQSTQINQANGVLNIGGFNDNIFNVIKSFLLLRNDKDFWIKTINGVSLD